MKKLGIMTALLVMVGSSLYTTTANATIINGADQTDATVTIQSGDLILSDITDVLTFNPLNVISRTASTGNSNTIDMRVADYRGTHTGWTLNAQFSDFNNLTTPGVALGSSGYINSFTKKVGVTKIDGTAIPTLNAASATIFTKADGTFPQFELARALGESGAGDATLRIPTNMFELVLTDKTKAGNYSGTITFNLVNGPAS